MPTDRQGFTLIEFIITLAVVAILAAVAIPTYTSYLEQGRRVEGQTALLDATNRIERYYSQYHSYMHVSLAELGLSPTTSQGYYVLGLSDLSLNSYRVTATPQGTQKDDACGTLAVNQLGQKIPVTKGCW